MSLPVPRGPGTGDEPSGEWRFEEDERVPGAGALFQYEAHGVAIELTNVSKWYRDLVAISDVTCRIGFGVTALLGPNGAGKSTLFRMLCGLTPPSKGTIAVLGANPRENLAMTTAIGLVPQQESVFEALSALDFVELAGVLHGIPRPRAAAADALAAVQLDPEDNRLLTTYSKGMRQRVKLAGALVHDPPVLLLDEPFNGMDPRQRLHMTGLLRQMASQGRTIVFSSHILEEVERLAGGVLVVYAGRLAAAGGFRQIRRLMTDRPHTFRVRSSDNRRLSAALLADPSVFGVNLTDGHAMISTSDFGAFTRALPRVAREAGISLFELTPTDDSLESVFAYLVRR
jgi:ABC-2 type transport system ATP-binding protein